MLLFSNADGLSNSSVVRAESEWKIADEEFVILLPIRYSISASWYSYFLFAFILYTCNKKFVIWKRRNDVFLILFFAFVVDLVKYRMYSFISYMPHIARDDSFWIVPTTTAACTVGFWTFWLYFYTTF
ncbi:hypothetical protein PMAYCL1PPCAC_21989, partial [Pristionchus mayeri]